MGRRVGRGAGRALHGGKRPLERGLNRLEFAQQLARRAARGAWAQDDHEIRVAREHVWVQPEQFANDSFPSVAPHRGTDFAGCDEAKPGSRTAVDTWESQEQEVWGPHRSRALLNSHEVAALSNAAGAQKAEPGGPPLHQVAPLVSHGVAGRPCSVRSYGEPTQRDAGRRSRSRAFLPGYFLNVAGTSRARPLRRRFWMTFRPPVVAMRARKPWVRTRRTLWGW
jgi:hypothetical protein